MRRSTAAPTSCSRCSCRPTRGGRCRASTSRPEGTLDALARAPCCVALGSRNGAELDRSAAGEPRARPLRRDRSRCRATSSPSSPARFQCETAERAAARCACSTGRATPRSCRTQPRRAVRPARALARLHGERYTGIPYPFDKFDFVLIRRPFRSPAMEHAASSLYEADRLLLDDSAHAERAPRARGADRARGQRISWFGDLVTMRWFDDVWTKEVFANFIAAEDRQPAVPRRCDHDLAFLLSHHAGAYAVDRSAGRPPDPPAARQPRRRRPACIASDHLRRRRRWCCASSKSLLGDGIPRRPARIPEARTPSPARPGPT